MTTRCRAGGTLAAGAPAVAADEVGAGSTLVEEDEALDGDSSDRFRPGLAFLQDRGLALLIARKVVRVSPRRLRARPTVQGCTRISVLSASRSRYSASVR